MIYDVTSQESYEDIENWLRKIDENADEGIVKVLVANKID